MFACHGTKKTEETKSSLLICQSEGRPKADPKQAADLAMLDWTELPQLIIRR